MAGNPQVLELLEEMLDSGKTPEEVCRDCPDLLPEVRERWKAFCRIDPQVRAWYPEPGTPPDADAVTPLPHSAGLPQVPGYAVEAVLGRGGMGVVYKARHLALKRTVALKMLAAGHCLPAERARFKAEAEAVARLQHPNIVQIHEVGEAGGLPFFALEFVEGGSLATRLAGRDLPPRDAARLVGALAEAMHLAHSRNLVHRDLKPANVLLGGEADTPIDQCQPKVTDFGLARQLDVDSGQTQEGVVMGTPSYMAPEQAEGRAHAAGPAADVYALGAILYECLTGRPPFKGATLLETLQQVRGQEPAAPSVLNRQVPRDLDTICLKCLRKPPEQRYSSARELAEDLGRFVRGEPVAARPIGVAEWVRKWVWRRPAAAGLLAAVVLLVVAGGVGVWLLYEQQATAQAREAQTDQEVRRVLGRARLLLEEGWQAADLEKLKDAEAEGIRAEDVARSGGASATVRQEAEAFREHAGARLGHARKNRTLLEALLDVSASQRTTPYIDNPAEPSVDEQYTAAFRAWGLDVDGTAESEVVARLGAEPEAVVQELIAGLDHWMLERRQQRPEAQWRRLLRVAEQLDCSDRHGRLRALLVGGSPPRAETVAGWIGVGSPWLALAQRARDSNWRQLLEVRREIDSRTDPVLTVVLLAAALEAEGNAKGAEQVLRQAVTARPDQVVLLDALGKLLERQGLSRLDEAIGYYRAARVKRGNLGIALSKALSRAGRAEQGEEVLQELVHQQPDNPVYWFHLGYALREQRKHAKAEKALRKAIALMPDFAIAYNSLGNALSEQRKHAEAEEALRKAIALKPDFALAHNNLGCTLGDQHRYAEAEAALRKAIALMPDFALAHNNLGNALSEQHKYTEAEAAYRKAIDLMPDHASAYNGLGFVLNAQRKHAQAQAAAHKAIALKPDIAYAYDTLGNALIGQGRHAEAEAAARKAIALKPDFARAYNTLGVSLIPQQKYAQAETTIRKAIALQSDAAGFHLVLAFALMQQAKFDEAIASLRKVDDLLPAKHRDREQARQLRQQCQRYLILDARLPAILRGSEKPANAAEQIELAQLCILKKHHAAVARFFRDAFAAEPKLADAVVPTGNRYDAACAAALTGCGQGKDADKLDDKERALWRRQALEWLRQDLAWWGRALDKGNAQTNAEIQQWMRDWQTDGDLAGVRAPDALARLPDEERQQWEKLWSDVDALLRRAGEPE
jgi:serine/threonine-protein kinase